MTDSTGTEQTVSTRPAAGRDFLRAIVAEDLRTGKHDGRVVTRFPPEPNGYLHIGHAKSICLNFGIAGEVPGGVCHLRFDDTNPTTEHLRYAEAIQQDVRWLGFDWGEHLYFASDYFERLYELAVELIKAGKAYVDSQTEVEIRENRGTITEPGRESPYRDRSVEENLDLFRRMRAGEFRDGSQVLRARIDMASPNMLMRDPLLYRIRHAHHYRTGDDWCIYPLYDFAHPLSDAIECVTHSLCTLEFKTNRELYDWVVENAKLPCRPHQYEFARLNLDYTVMSKRKLLELVQGGFVSGWDDPRMPTIAGLRRRGVTPESIRTFCDMIGVAKADSRVDIGKLEFAVRDDLNHRAPRVMCVLRPLRVVITNYPEDTVEELDAPYWPHDVPKEGTRKLPFSRVIYIERDDFMEDPPKGFFRLAPGREVRLRHAYFIRCEEVVKDDDGVVAELRCTYDPATRGGAAPDGRRVRGTLHWVSADHALPCEARLYDRLFRVSDPEAGGEDVDFKTFLNPESLVVVDGARIEPSVAEDTPGSHYQFERQGYFYSDPVDSGAGRLVYNRTVTLRGAEIKAKFAMEMGLETGPPPLGSGADSREPGTEARSAGPAEASVRTTPGPSRGATAEEEQKATRTDAPGGRKAAGRKGGAPPAPERVRTPDLEARYRRYSAELGLPATDANVLTRDTATADLFDGAVGAGADPGAVANWIINELPRELDERDIASLPFGSRELASLIRLVGQGEISSSAARQVLAELAAEGGEPAEIVERRGLRQISDAAALGAVVNEVIAANPDKAEGYRSGRTGLIRYFMGQVMSRTGGRANPELTRRLLQERLDPRRQAS